MPITRAQFATPQGRQRAWRELTYGDHGFLRKIYDNTHQISPRVWRSYQPSPATARAAPPGARAAPPGAQHGGPCRARRAPRPARPRDPGRESGCAQPAS